MDLDFVVVTADDVTWGLTVDGLGRCSTPGEFVTVNVVEFSNPQGRAFCQKGNTPQSEKGHQVETPQPCQLRRSTPQILLETGFVVARLEIRLLGLRTI